MREMHQKRIRSTVCELDVSFRFSMAIGWMTETMVLSSNFRSGNYMRQICKMQLDQLLLKRRLPTDLAKLIFAFALEAQLPHEAFIDPFDEGQKQKTDRKRQKRVHRDAYFDV